MGVFRGNPFLSPEARGQRLNGLADAYLSGIMELPLNALAMMAPDAGITPGELRSSPKDRMKGQQLAWDEYRQGRAQNPDYAKGANLGTMASYVADPFMDLPFALAGRLAKTARGLTLPSMGNVMRSKLASQAGSLPIDDFIVRGESGTMANMGDYMGGHRPMTVEQGASTLDDLTPAFGEDIYSPNAVQYFGTGDTKLDKQTVSVLTSLRGKPGADVIVYRAVPKGSKVEKLNPGEWVTVNRDYAKLHGEGSLGGKYDIVQQKVKAKDLTTSSDSFHEQGYYPK